MSENIKNSFYQITNRKYINSKNKLQDLETLTNETMQSIGIVEGVINRNKDKEMRFAKWELCDLRQMLYYIEEEKQNI